MSEALFVPNSSKLSILVYAIKGSSPTRFVLYDSFIGQEHNARERIEAIHKDYIFLGLEDSYDKQETKRFCSGFNRSMAAYELLYNKYKSQIPA